MASPLDTCPVPFTSLEWDSDHFGFPVGRLNSAYLTSDLAGAAIDWARDNSVRCLYFLADPGDSTLLAMARQWNFDLVDARLTMKLDRLDPKAHARPVSLEIERASDSDGPRLEEIASSAHRDTRFFLDTRFPEDRARDLYRKWVRRDIAEGRLLVARKNGDRLGYVSLTLPQQGKVCSVSLIGVAPEARGMGVGSRLLGGALEFAKERDFDSVEVVTQAANIAAQRLYQSAGFRSSSCEYWFHRWFS